MCISFFHHMLTNPNYRCDRDDVKLVPEYVEANKRLKSFFTTEIVRCDRALYFLIKESEFVEILVTKYLLTTDGDLEMWENDPEEFVMEDLRGAWQENVQECASVVLSTLSVEFPQIVPELVNNNLRSIQNGLKVILKHFNLLVNKPNVLLDLESVLRKDACYLAVSTLAPRLQSVYITFSPFFKEALVVDLHVNHPLYVEKRLQMLIF
jgi:hypothetical protein